MAQFDINFTPSFVPSGLTTDPLAVTKSRYDQLVAGLRAPQQTQPRGTQGPLYSGSKNAYFIGGREISARDEAGLLEAATTTDFSVPYEVPTGDWAQVDTGQFGSMIQKIADPDLLTRMGKSFESGMASSGELLGAAARFAGLEEPGKVLMESSQRRQQELSPYSVGFTDIGKDPTVDAIDWIASTVGQLGPSIIETLITTVIGAGVGAAAGGPPSATVGALAGFVGKQAFKDALKTAVTTYEKQALKTLGKETLEGTARQAAIKAAPKAEVIAALRATPEGKAALKTLRTAGGITGGFLANVGSSYLTGIGDISADQLSSGVSPDQLNRLGIGLIGAPVYAAFEALPETTLFGRIAGEAFGGTKDLVRTKSFVDRARSVLAKAGQQGVLEGATEVGQEGILLASNPLTNWNDPEIANRVINSFAAGTLMGGALGGVSAFAPTDLLNPNRDINKDTEQGQQTQVGEEQGPKQQLLLPPPPAGAPPMLALPPPVSTSTNFYADTSGNVRDARYGEAVDPTAALALPAPTPTPTPTPAPLPEAPYVPGPSVLYASPTGEVQVPGQAPAYMPRAPRTAILQRGVIGQRPIGALPSRTNMEGTPAKKAARVAMFERAEAAGVKSPATPNTAIGEQLMRGKVADDFNLAEVAAQDRNANEVATSVDTTKLPVELAIDAADGNNKPQNNGKRKVLSWFNGLSKEQQDTVLGDERYNNEIDEFIKDVRTAKSYANLVKYLESLVPGAPTIKSVEVSKAAAPAPAAPAAPAAEVAPKTASTFQEEKAPPRKQEQPTEEVESGPKSTSAGSTQPSTEPPAATPAAKPAKPATSGGNQPTVTVPPSMDDQVYLSFFEDLNDLIEGDPITDRTVRIDTQRSFGERVALAEAIDPDVLARKLPNGRYVGEFFQKNDAGNLYMTIDKDGYVLYQPDYAPAKSISDENRDIAATMPEILNDAVKAFEGKGNFFRIDGTPIANPMEVGRVKLLLNTIKSKLRIAPKTHVFRSLQELKSSNPALYRAAKAARTEGDFDTVKAAGYSFGDTVILFSDNIQTEQQLRFIMAHETIGHFGLRSIADAASVNKLLNSLYDNDFRVRTATDAYMTRMGIPKLEAIEEVLADNAAHLDTSLLARITTFIKHALNKIGVTFGDEFAREVVSQLRKYVRYGELNGTPVSATQIAENMIRLEEQAKIGRFSQNNTFTSVAQGFNWLASLANGVFTGRQDLRVEAQRFLSDNKTNVGELFKDVLSAFSTPQGQGVQNYGTQRINSIFTDMSRLRNTVISRLVEVAPDLYKIATGKPDLRQAEEMFIHRMLELYMNFKPGAEQKDPDLVYADKFEADGTPIRNDEAIAAYKKRILATPEMFQKGINFRDGSAPFKDTNVTKDSPAYKLYSQMVDVLTEQQILRLQSVIRGGKVNANLAFAYLRSAEADDAQIAIIEEARRLYTNLAMKNATIDKDSGMIKLNDEAKTKADKFAFQVSRVMSKEFGDSKLKDWLEGNPKEDSEQFRTSEFDDFITKLSKLNKLKLDNYGLTEVNTLIVNSVFNTTGVRDAQLYAKQSILRHYTPLDRSGEYAVKVAVVDEKGDTVSLSKESMSQIPYYEFDTKAEADAVMAELNEAFATQFKDPDLTDVNGDKIDNKYRLVAFSGAVSKTAEMRVTVNPNMLIKAIENLGIKLPADAIEKLVTKTTSQNAAARRNLERNVNAGFRRDIRNVQAEFSEFIASVVANNVHRPEVDDLFKGHNQWMWVGKRRRLDELKTRIEAAQTAEERREAEQKYAEYATQFRYSANNTTAEGLDGVEVNGTKYKLMGRGNKYREMAARMVDTLNRSNGELVEVSEAIFGKGFGAKLRSFSVLAQLGGSVASGLLNIIGLSTNTWSYLAYMNKQNGFGGGYGAANSALAINKALADTSSPKLNDIEYLKGLTPGNKHNLTAGEINFLIKVAEDGELAASQSQALMGATRGRNPTVQKLMDGWMSVFNYTEQLTRRTTALATFRLEYQRQLALFGANPTAEQKSAASSRATKFAEAAVGYTQGRYGMMDRPELGRTGLLQYPFQYKQFVINTIELLANMDTRGRVQYLTMMLILAGVSGLPFAEDIGDLLDTLLSFFGIPRANVEKEMLMFYDSVIPGSAEWINKGILDQLIGVSVSSRIGMGNIVPLTSVGVPGTDITREFMDFTGPVVGLLAGTTSFVDGILSMPLEAAGIKAGETSLRDVFRNSPVTALRSVGDAWAYLDTGAIVSADGRMVADNVSGFTIFMRLFGFYPAEASKQNNMVRLGKQSDAYRNDIAAKFRLDYIRAGMSNGMKGNREAMARVIDEVERWNKSAKGTGLEINNFVKNARNALKDAKMSTAERFLKATSKANRPVMEELADVMGIE